jgi:MFS family permease
MVHECAKDSKHKGLLGSMVQLASPIGFLLASGVFAIITATVSEQALLSWGWRVPFLASAILVLVGLYVRLSISASSACSTCAKPELSSPPPSSRCSCSPRCGPRWRRTCRGCFRSKCGSPAPALGFQAAGILGGALAPTICVMLLKDYGSALPVSLYLGSTLVLALLCILLTPAASKR